MTTPVKKVKKVTETIIFLDEGETRVIIGDIIYKRELKTPSRSAYMKQYRRRKQRPSRAPPQPEPSITSTLTT